MQIGRSRAGRDPSDPTYHWWETTRADQDHVEVPLSRGWRIAGTIIAATVVMALALTVFAERDAEPIGYRAIRPTEIVTDAIEPPVVTGVEVQIDPALPREGRIRVDGDGLVRVDVTGRAVCQPISGAAGAWIGIRLCGALDELAVTAFDDDHSPTTAVARF